MVWTIEFAKSADKQLERLDKQTKQRIRRYLREHAQFEPRKFGKALTADKRGLWRYRIGKYRVICQIKDETITVLVLKIGKRDTVYDD